MVQLEKVNFSHDKALDGALRIYEESFPANERRSVRSIIRQIDYNGDYNFFIVLEDNRPVGMAVVWVIESRFIYIEHLAIAAERRSSGIGSMVMKLLMDKSPFPTIIEVEKKLEGMSEEELMNCERRLRFYAKHDFVISEKPYVQPAYGKGLEPVEMQLMERDGHLLDEDFEGVKRALYRHVYKIK